MPKRKQPIPGSVNQSESDRSSQELIFDHSIDLTFLIGVENGRYRFISVNQAFLSAAMRTRDQVEGKNIEEVIPEATLTTVLPKYEQAIREKQTVQWEDTSQYPDGIRTGVVTITPIFNEQGICTMLVGTLHDITERKRSEELISAKEKQLDLIYNTVNDVIFLLAVEPGPRYRFTSVNNSFMNTTGLTREQIEGKYVNEVIPEPSLSLVLNEYSLAIREHRTVRWEETTAYPTGLRTGIVSITPVYNDRDECDMLVGAVHDITVSKKNQEEKDQASYLLRERVKELTTLYGAGQILNSETKPVEDAIKDLVNILPPGWQYPDITETRIMLGEKEFATAGFDSIVNSQSAGFMLPDGQQGQIEVGYTKETPPESEGVFFEEERNMLNMLAEMLRLYFVRKDASGKLQKEKDLSQSIIDALPGVFYLFDENGKYLQWNKNHETVTGYSGEEMRQMHPLKFVDEDEKDLIVEGMKKVFTDGYTSVEANLLCKDGRKIPYYFNGVRIIHEDRLCVMGMGIDIADRKKVEENQRKSEERFRILVDSAPDATVIVDEKGIIQMVNRQTEQILGYGREELLGQPVEILIPAELHGKHHGYRENYQKEPRTREMGMGMELYAVKKGGEKIPVEISLAPIKSEEGTHIIASLRDITERKKAAEKIREEKEISESIIQSLPGVFYVFDDQGQFHRWNKNFETVTGYGAEEILQMHPLNFIDTDEHTLITESIGKVFTEGYTSVEASFLCKDGSKVPHYFNGVRTMYEGKLCLIGMGIEISDRKKFEEQRKNSEERFRILVDSAPDATVIVDEKGIIQMVNRQTEQILGYGREELLGQPVEILIPAELHGKHHGYRENYQKGPKTREMGMGMELFAVKKGGEKLPVEISLAPFESGEGVHIIASLRDITERKKAAEQIQREKELLESLVQSLPGIFYLFDMDGHYLRWNKNHETVPGYTAEEMKQMHPLKFFLPEEQGLIAERIGKVFTEGYAFAEAGFLHKDGHTIPYFFNGINIIYEGKSCLMGVGIDISDRVKIENELREAENKFRTLVEKSQVGVYIVQRGKFSYVNPRIAEMFGYEEEEMINMDPINDLILEEYHDIVRENVQARMDGKIESVHYEIAGKGKQGNIVRVELFGSRTTYAGKPAIIGTMVDITDRKLAEEALQKSEANLQTIFDSTDTIYTLLDNDFRIVSYNQKALDNILRQTGKEFKVNDEILQYFPPDKRDLIKESMLKALKGIPVSYESAYGQKDGSTQWYHVRMYPITTQEKRKLGLIMALSDITEKKLLEQKILNQRVEEQKKITRALLAGQEKERNLIGQELHDNVNQILVGAKMYLGLTKESDPSNDNLIRETMGLIDNAINEIKILTREQVTPNKQIDLQDLIRNLVEKLVEQSSIQAEFDYDIGSYTINDDLKLNIYRIIQEGINNILRHASATRVNISVKAGEQALSVSIRDDGKGFDSGKKAKGIGISNIRNRVESYNGRISIDSSPAQGCNIELSIPI